VLELIDAHLDARVDVDMLAREAGLSPAHFARRFKRRSAGRPTNICWSFVSSARGGCSSCAAPTSQE